jgi:hypothetical protein
MNNFSHTAALTDGQRKLLAQAATGPVVVTAEMTKRIAEALAFRGRVRLEGHLTRELTVHITEKGIKALAMPPSKRSKRS